MVGNLVLGRDVSGFLSPPVAVCGRRLQLRHVMSSAASQVHVMVPRESWACAVLRWRVMVWRESWTYAALLETRSASGHRHIPLSRIKSWLASSHGLIGFLCHVTVAGVMVSVTSRSPGSWSLESRSTFDCYASSWNSDLYSILLHSLRINTDPGYIGGHIY